MGVPKFFRWVSERYPLINTSMEGHLHPEFDHLYLDMNGIIHRCTHPDDDSKGGPKFLSEREMVENVFGYLEEIFSLVKPCKVFFMAVDGVAPRAKMNQQRARRFRSARERNEALEKARSEGVPVPEDPFDSNCITPGTPFMTRLSEHIKYFVRHKLSTDPAWRRCQIVFSGQEVPGEGEHKIMEFIRECKARHAFATRQNAGASDLGCAALSEEEAAEVERKDLEHKRELAAMWPKYTVLSEGACAGEDWSADESHCIYGLDADLIMLGLLTHETHFALLREKVLGLSRKGGNRVQTKQAGAAASGTVWELLHLSLVREYLEEEFRDQGPLHNGQELELERVIDDVLFLFFFIGNDFLPNLPYLEIKEGAMEVMLTGYKHILPQMDDYITFKGTINWERVRLFIRQVIIPHEQQVLKEFEICFDELGGRLTDEECSDDDADARAGTSGAGGLAAFFDDGDTTEPYTTSSGERSVTATRSTPASAAASSAVPAAASIELGEPTISGEEDMSWRDSYYTSRFEGRHRGHDVDFYKGVALSYAQGLAWVLRYYYDGCVSWGWYFPQHYSPLATDLVELVTEKDFEDAVDALEPGYPFLPFEQLMGVLPPGSKACVPVAYQRLMTDPDSPILEYYREDFKLDLNGKQNDWEAVVLLPFIDEKRLRDALATVPLDQIPAEQWARNRFGPAMVLTYDETVSGPYKHPCPSEEYPEFFPTIAECPVRESLLLTPSSFFQAPAGSERPLLEEAMPNAFGSLVDYHFTATADGTHGVRSRPTFPSLRFKQFRSRLERVGVTVFGFGSSHPSMLLSLEDEDEDENEDERSIVVGSTLVG